MLLLQYSPSVLHGVHIIHYLQFFIISGGCDFESGTCDWSSFDNGLYIWHRTAAQDAPSGRAPSVDHTLGSAAGSYVFVDSSSGTFGVTALLVSPPQLGRTGQR